jgi:hypothetical protein
MFAFEVDDSVWKNANDIEKSACFLYYHRTFVMRSLIHHRLRDCEQNWDGFWRCLVCLLNIGTVQGTYLRD